MTETSEEPNNVNSDTFEWQQGLFYPTLGSASNCFSFLDYEDALEQIAKTNHVQSVFFSVSCYAISKRIQHSLVFTTEHYKIQN